MLIAQCLAVHGESLAEQRLRLTRHALGAQQGTQEDDAVQRVRVPVSQRLAPRDERLAEQRFRLAEPTLEEQQARKFADARQRVRMPVICALMCSASFSPRNVFTCARKASSSDVAILFRFASRGYYICDLKICEKF